MTHRPIHPAMHAAALLALLILPWPVSAQETRRVERVPTQESGLLHDAERTGAESIPVALEPDSASSSNWVLPIIGGMIGAGLALMASNDCGQSTSCISIPIFEAGVGALLGAAVGFVIELALE